MSTADNTTKSTKGKAGIDGRIVSSSDGPNGFVFKPESDHERKLVVLLPSKFGHSVEGVSLVKRDGELVERGRSSGFANGDREHFRFNLAGSRYPNNILVQVLFKDGDKLFYRIDDPGRRHD